MNSIGYTVYECIRFITLNYPEPKLPLKKQEGKRPTSIARQEPLEAET